MITTHVLDTAAGRPATGVAVRLAVLDDAVPDGAGWREVGAAVTDADGRVRAIGPERLDAGPHRLTFDTGAYFAASGRECFYPEVAVTFTVSDPDEHYHVPILLSPFAVSTYRGS